MVDIMKKFEKYTTMIEGLYIIKCNAFVDERGFFMETYNKESFEEIGIDTEFVQDNHSKSVKGVLRGLHFQRKYGQAKLVRVIKGEVFDVAVDLRKNSKTYGKYYGIVLTENNKLQFFIPKGFAHGFLVLSDEAEFVYKCDEFYHPEDESGIIWNDSTININWPLEKIGGEKRLILSQKDINWSKLSDANQVEED